MPGVPEYHKGVPPKWKELWEKAAFSRLRGCQFHFLRGLPWTPQGDTGLQESAQEGVRTPEAFPVASWVPPSPEGLGSLPAMCRERRVGDEFKTGRFQVTLGVTPETRTPHRQASEAALASEAGGGVHGQSRKEQTGRVKGRKGAPGAEPRSQAGP